ncbi:DUF6401 family natural product biosynthesis protein [Dactylosporangium sp. NPDC048998]|uniref:DUF6401 family natural product biosynthesis protein n=1 Tax=Dactylosporangium sp. NPDC048998 TaxID=3363976 RepID=UPI00371C2C45
MSNDTSFTAAGTGSGAFGDFSEATRLTVARSTLNGLMTWLGEAGLAAARESAGLQAAIDQHAASVRDALGDPAPGLGAVPLAGYATGVRDALIEAQWQLAPSTEVDWSNLEWPALRLIAICALARAGGHA